MFRVINFAVLIRYVAIITTFASIFAYEIIREHVAIEFPLTRIFSIAPWVAVIIIFAITTRMTARVLWKCISLLGLSNYPDLNGSWEGEILPSEGGGIPARAMIRQSLLETQIDLHTMTAKSLTLETTPVVESGQNKLYYKYRSIPKDLTWPSYVGATTFDIRVISDNNECYIELSGAYFTDRKSVGRVRLRQTSPKTSSDVSYY